MGELSFIVYFAAHLASRASDLSMPVNSPVIVPARNTAAHFQGPLRGDSALGPGSVRPQCCFVGEPGLREVVGEMIREGNRWCPPLASFGLMCTKRFLRFNFFKFKKI